MLRSTGVLSILAVLAACAPEEKAPPTPAAQALDTSLPGKAADQSTPPKLELAIAVDAEGLRLIAPQTGSTQPLPFNSDQTMVIAAVEKLRGTAKIGRNEECGAGPVDIAEFGGLALLFQDGKFGGWSLQNSETSGIGTMNGIAIGSTRKELEAAFPTFTIDPESTLGTEFHTGTADGIGISGLLDGNGTAAKATNLWSGLSCVFR